MTDHKYELAFKDMFDGWIDCYVHTDDLEMLKTKCDEKNKELNQSNKDCGEHYGIFERQEQGWPAWKKIYGNAL
jgi:hypothetical protein